MLLFLGLFLRFYSSLSNFSVKFIIIGSISSIIIASPIVDISYIIFSDGFNNDSMYSSNLNNSFILFINILAGAISLVSCTSLHNVVLNAWMCNSVCASNLRSASGMFSVLFMFYSSSLSSSSAFIMSPIKVLNISS